jgi:hypothetical protein
MLPYGPGLTASPPVRYILEVPKERLRSFPAHPLGGQLPLKTASKISRDGSRRSLLLELTVLPNATCAFGVLTASSSLAPALAGAVICRYESYI